MHCAQKPIYKSQLINIHINFVAPIFPDFLTNIFIKRLFIFSYPPRQTNLIVANLLHAWRTHIIVFSLQTTVSEDTRG